MISPVDFDSFFKIIGGVGVLSLISQVTSFFKTIDEMKKIKNDIEEKRLPDKQDPNKKRNYPPHVENNLKKIADGKLKDYFMHFIIIVSLSLISVIWYAIAKNINLLSNTKDYFVIISIISYSILIAIPLYFLIIIYRLFSLYYKLIEYKNYNDLYNYPKKS